MFVIIVGAVVYFGSTKAKEEAEPPRDQAPVIGQVHQGAAVAKNAQPRPATTMVVERRLDRDRVASVLGGCALLGEEGSGVIVTRQLRITDDVDRVEIGDAFRTAIRVEAATPSGTVRIDDNLIDRLRVSIDGDTLSIDLDGRVRTRRSRRTSRSTVWNA